MHVVPEYLQRSLDRAASGNFSLVFARGTQWRVDRGQLKADIVQLGQRGTNLLPKASSTLQGVHQRQRGVLESTQSLGGFALEIRARLTSPFVSGLASGHPTETGMILDRNTGMPFIPASAIKGVLRLAHAVNILRSGEAGEWITQRQDEIELSDREPSLRKYFGDTDTSAADGVRGQLVFLDAFPESPPSLKADIMNPHFHKYYGENQPPVDCEDPIPVKFLSVEAGTVFVFRVLAAPLSVSGKQEQEPVEREFGPEDDAHVRAMFDTAFDELGFGGKTAVGYGRFQDIDGSALQPGSPTFATPSPAQLGQAQAFAVPPVDPETARQAEVEAFRGTLPKLDKLPGEMDKLIEAIKRKTDEETRKRCCEALLRYAETGGKSFKKAKNGGKAWAVKLMTLCEELGVM